MNVVTNQPLHNGDDPQDMYNPTVSTALGGGRRGLDSIDPITFRIPFDEYDIAVLMAQAHRTLYGVARSITTHNTTSTVEIFSSGERWNMIAASSSSSSVTQPVEPTCEDSTLNLVPVFEVLLVT